ncbi:tyrosine-protein phosphatase non-receptor type substrate 1-like [Scyliorhinus canicula]|uniref:tyrosine-protein phosphatase non-receptor type substrate 1-like n=1 Tax=Scyliorhinus canicula TaxID=7830 RepID=UPI0018F68D7F|nr:tyrosine-protein phosphatase non-receptor type substrate 1-like [Scyliorhinus canicula]
MSLFHLVHYLSVLGIIYTAPDAAALSVVQMPDRLTPVEGTNVTMNCSVKLLFASAKVDTYWWKDLSEAILNRTADERKLVTPFKQGSVELHLLNVSFEDSGFYYCSVKEEVGKVSNGNGTELIVHVPPTPVNITLLSKSPPILICTTGGFFPEELNLTWYINGTEIISGANGTQRWNEKGLYRVSSSLKPVDIWSVYTCQVSHVSLGNPANESYSDRDQDKPEENFPSALLVGFAAGGLVMLVMMVTLTILVMPCKSDDRAITEDMTDQFDEQSLHGTKTGNPIYADINFREQGETGKPGQGKKSTEYAQIKHGIDGNLIYASLDVTDVQTGANKPEENFPSALLVGFAAGGLIMLVMMVTLTILVMPCKSDDRAIMEDMTDQFDEQSLHGTKTRNPIYADINFREQRETGKPGQEKKSTEYAQIKHGIDGNLIYASLDVTDVQTGIAAV